MQAKVPALDWSKIKLVIFDVDGTLYSQGRLRKMMLKDLLGYYMLRPWRFKELMILQRFRSEREHRDATGITNLEQAQYDWCAEKAKVSADVVRKITQKWIFTHPNQYLERCIFPGVQAFFKHLRKNGIKTAIYSDYKAEEKLVAMQLEADMVVSSTDGHIDAFKPNPKGLLYIAAQMGVPVSECLFIGDRDEKDGQCARNAGMPYLILGGEQTPADSFYTLLQKHINTNVKHTLYESNIG